MEKKKANAAGPLWRRKGKKGSSPFRKEGEKERRNPFLTLNQGKKREAEKREKKKCFLLVRGGRERGKRGAAVFSRAWKKTKKLPRRRKKREGGIGRRREKREKERGEGGRMADVIRERKRRKNETKGKKEKRDGRGGGKEKKEGGYNQLPFTRGEEKTKRSGTPRMDGKEKGGTPLHLLEGKEEKKRKHHVLHTCSTTAERKIGSEYDAGSRGKEKGGKKSALSFLYPAQKGIKPGFDKR